MMVSRDIAGEVVFLCHSFLLGAVITFAYDGFLILRKLFKHTIFLISLEDLIFWIACALSVFGVLYEENNGMLRWFAVAGATVGMLVYKKTLSPLIIRAVTKLLSFVFGLIGKAFRIIMKPFGFLGLETAKGGRFLKREAGNFRKLLRKKLTEVKKTLKILLYKQ